MTIECMTVQGLHTILLSLTPEEKWASAGSYGNPETAGRLLAVLAVISLIVIALLLFRVFTRYKRVNSGQNREGNGLPRRRFAEGQEDHIQADNAKQPQPETVEAC